MADIKEQPATADASHPAIERRASRASRDDAVLVADEEELGHFGYEQELKRDWGLMHNFGISFSIIVCSPLLPLFPFGPIFERDGS